MKQMLVVTLAMVLFGGCSIIPADYVTVKDVPVVVADQDAFHKAVLAGAVRRGWTPLKIDEATFRMTLDRRGTKFAVVDVVLTGKNTFSIFMIENHVSVRKYNKWVNNLQREIVLCASAGSK